MKKKIIYAVLAIIILVGIIIISAIGLNVDLIYKKNVELDISIGKVVNLEDIRQIVEEVFPGEKAIIQTIEYFNDKVAITLPDRPNKDMADQIETLNTKINEKYGIDHNVDEIEIYHNPKVKLSSVLQPFFTPMLIATGIILLMIAVSIAVARVFSAKYKNLSIWKTILTYGVSLIGIEAIYLSLLAITRIPINRLTIPVGLVIYVATIVVLGFKYMKIIKELPTKAKI